MTDWIDKHLIEEARQFWRLWSVKLLAAALMVDAMTLGPVLALLPASVRDMNPLLFDILQMVLVAAALLARLLKQKKVADAPAPPAA